jgi:tRNA (cytidine/uridine-2'-O-)-methyltransferase
LLDLNFLEILVIAAVALVLLGPKEFVAFMQRLGGWIARLKYNISLFQDYWTHQITENDKSKSQLITTSLKPSINIMSNQLRLALYQPEIPQNAGTLMRTASCLGVGFDIIEPCGFVWNDQKMKRSGMDYMQHVDLQRHASWQDFVNFYQGKRIILIDTHGRHNYSDFYFHNDDVLLLGREADGVPQEVYEQCTDTVRINMSPDRRSLNVAIAGCIVLSEALRQYNSLR